jgi:hypothetical protein
MASFQQDTAPPGKELSGDEDYMAELNFNVCRTYGSIKVTLTSNVSNSTLLVDVCKQLLVSGSAVTSKATRQAVKFRGNTFLYGRRHRVSETQHPHAVIKRIPHYN